MTIQTRSQPPDHSRVQRWHRPGGPKNRATAILVSESPRAISSGCRGAWPDDPRPAKETRTICWPGLEATATTNQQARCPGEQEVYERGLGDKIEGTDYLFTLAPLHGVMVFITSWNICCDLSFGISCDPEGCPHVVGHILPVYCDAVV